MHRASCIVITGVSRGLGRALTQKFVKLGQTVVGCGRNEVDLRDLGKKLGPAHLLQAVDVLDWAAVKGWASAALDKYGAPDLLINNAALINKNNRLWEVPSEEFSNVIDVGLKGTTNVLRAFLPSMIKSGRGIIVNFSSGAGRSGYPKIAPYCAAKWGIEGLTKALAKELPNGMAAIPLGPGPVNTDMLKSTFGKESAANYPNPAVWAERAAPYILNLKASHNGISLTVE